MKLFDELTFDEKGLIPAIIQNEDGRVLTLCYMNRGTIEESLTTGKVHVFRRSKGRPMMKGETSGHTLSVIDILPDCDQDTLLIYAAPKGPTCHQNTTSCFGEETAPGIGFIAHLANRIATREKERPADSYTTELFTQGINRIAQKVGEEGVETALAIYVQNILE